MAEPRSSPCSFICRATARRSNWAPLYKRHFNSVRGLYSWHGRFRKVKQFPFLPNTGYAFAVSNSLGKKSWHGRETVPSGIGVRNSIITFYFASDERGY